MKIIYSKKHKKHNPPFEIYDGVKESYAEKADRIEGIVKTLREKGFGKYIQRPFRFPKKYIQAIHHREYVRFLREKTQSLKKGNVLYPSYFMMDTYTPLVSGTYHAAIESVNIALTGAKYILQGEPVIYSLCRPPGHHASEKSTGGYCYFNNAAIAANFLASYGNVAILDIDFHHGNGTQSIFYDRSDVLYLSIHADPRKRFPYSSGFVDEIGRGDGKGFTKNYPLSLGTKNSTYLRVLEKTIQDIENYSPAYLIISLGFDTYAHDPIGGFKLTESFYSTIGKTIANLHLPTLIIQEGGYNTKALGGLAYNFLNGFIK